MAAQNYPNAYLGDEAGNRSYAYSSTETVVDKDTGKTLKQILQEGGAGTGAVNTVDGIAPENGNVALLSPAQAAPSGTAIPLDADTLQGHAAGEFAKAVNYSTQEQPTGELWVDGKKVYRKVITVQSPSSSTFMIPVGETVDSLVDLRGLIEISNGNILPIPFFQNANYIGLLLASDKVNVSVFSSGYTFSNVTIFISYTKPEE